MKRYLLLDPVDKIFFNSLKMCDKNFAGMSKLLNCHHRSIMALSFATIITGILLLINEQEKKDIRERLASLENGDILEDKTENNEGE